MQITSHNFRTLEKLFLERQIAVTPDSFTMRVKLSHASIPCPTKLPNHSKHSFA